MGNRKNILEFTSRLYELFCEQQFSLSESLEIIGGGDSHKKIKNACNYLNKKLSEGNTLSNSLKTCGQLNFDRIFVNFMEYAERTENLFETIKFLKAREERHQMIVRRLFEASVYPVFVLALSIFISLMVWFYAGNIAVCENLDYELKESFISAFLFLFSFIGFLILILKINLGGLNLYEAFLSTGFLIKAGVNVATAVGLGANMLGLDTKYGKLFIDARLRIEYGMGIERAFFSNKKELKLLGKKIHQTFYYAQKSGGKNDVFERVAGMLWGIYERKSKVWLSMIEPFFITGTGIFITILLMNYFLPLMDGLNLISF